MLLRRAVILQSADVTVAGGHGGAWIESLAVLVPNNILLQHQLSLLTELPYHAQISTQDVKLLASLVRTVIQAHVNSNAIGAGRC
jgi:hypothetical protein